MSAILAQALPRKYVLSLKAWRTLAALLLCLLVFAPSLPAHAHDTSDEHSPNISGEQAGVREIEFIIDAVANADYYKIPDDPAGFNCSPRNPSSKTSLGALITWKPKKRYPILGASGEYEDKYMVRYCGLQPDHNFTIKLEAWQKRTVQVWFHGRSVTSQSNRKIAQSSHTIRTKPLSSATATPAPPLRNFGIVFENFTDITVSWFLPPNQSVAGNKLEIFNGNSTNLDDRFLLVPLFRGQTTQRVNGLTAGNTYNVRLTLGFIGGATRSGDAGIYMAKPGDEGLGTGCLGCDAPPELPTATPVHIIIGVGVHSSTEATLSWSAVDGATGYLLEYSGGNNESGRFSLGSGVTSQRINGLTAGGSYDVYLTAYMQDGSTHQGVGFFAMPDPPTPTNTPIPPPPPPTNTPIPPPPPTNTPIPPPPPTDTPVRLGASSEDNQQPSGPYASLIQTLIGYQAETQHGKPHVERWTRALAALGWGSHANPMTLAEAKQMAQQFSSARWDPVVAALTQLQPAPTNTPVPPPPPTNTPVPPPPPTNTPVPPPPPSNTPVPPPPPSNTPVPPPPPTNTPVPPPPPTNTPVPPAYTVPQSLIDTLKGYEAETQHGPEHVRRWTRALAALGHGSGDPMSLSEAKDMARRFSANRWNPVIEALEKLAGG